MHQEEVIENQQLQPNFQYAQFQVELIDKTQLSKAFVGEISNNYKYIASFFLVNEYLKIWNYNYNLIKRIKLNNICSCKFTTDSKQFFVGTKIIYQYQVDGQFKRLRKFKIHNNYIINIYCISNTIILTASLDCTIVKTNVYKNQQLLKIYVNNDHLYAFDYNKFLKLIASGSQYKCIKIWNDDGCQIIEKKQGPQQCQEYTIGDIKIWNIDSQKQQLDELYFIPKSRSNMSLVCEQQYLIAIGAQDITIYTSQGGLIKQFKHNINQICLCNIVQPESMKALLIIAYFGVYVCKIKWD